LVSGAYVEIRCPKCGRISVFRHETNGEKDD
jgi:phage FluMu protein Com